MKRDFICITLVTGADPRIEAPYVHSWSKETRSPRQSLNAPFPARCPDHDGLGSGDGPEENLTRGC